MERFEEALESFETARRLSSAVPSILSGMGHTLGRLGRVPEARACLQELHQQARTGWVPAVCFALVPWDCPISTARSPGWKTAAARREISVAAFKIHPMYDPLRSQPRFQKSWSRSASYRNNSIRLLTAYFRPGRACRTIVHGSLLSSKQRSYSCGLGFVSLGLHLRNAPGPDRGTARRTIIDPRPGVQPGCADLTHALSECAGQADDVTLHGLAALLWEEGRAPEAVPLFERALQLRRERIGASDVSMLPLWTGLALAHRDSGDYVSSRSIAAMAVSLAETHAAEQTAPAAASFVALGSLLESQGQLAQAEEWIGRGLKLREQLFGPAGIPVANALVFEGALYQHARRWPGCRRRVSKGRADL